MLLLSPVVYTDLLEMEPQAEQTAWFCAAMNENVARMLAANEYARTVRAPDGKILLCCGVVELHPGLASAWTLLSLHASPYMFGIVKAMRDFLSMLPHRRVEMSIRAGFGHGHKWARLLGFTREGILRCYGENGEDHHLYARVRE